MARKLGGRHRTRGDFMRSVEAAWTACRVAVRGARHERVCAALWAAGPATCRAAVGCAAMIALIWRGATKADRAQDYLEYLRGTGLADYAATPATTVPVERG